MPPQVDLKSSLSIGALSRAAGLRPSTLRYYEEIGLLPSPDRVNGRRTYSPTVLERLRRITLAQSAGFTLKEIKLLELGLASQEEAPARWRRMAAQKLGEVDEQLGRLRKMRNLLHAALSCNCTSMSRCPLIPRGAPPAPRAPTDGLAAAARKRRRPP